MFPIFLWVKKYRNLENFSLNLDSNYNVKFNIESGERKLTIEKNEEVEKENFYGENIDSINLLIGKNGSGKTSIVNIFGILEGDKRNIEHFIIYKTKIKDEYIIEGYFENNYRSSINKKGTKMSKPKKRDYEIFIKNRDEKLDFIKEKPDKSKREAHFRKYYSIVIDKNGKFINFCSSTYPSPENFKNIAIGVFQEDVVIRNPSSSLRAERNSIYSEDGYFKDVYNYLEKFNSNKNYKKTFIEISIINYLQDQYKFLKLDEILNKEQEEEIKKEIILYRFQDVLSKDSFLKNYLNGFYLNLLDEKIKEENLEKNNLEKNYLKVKKINEKLKNECKDLDIKKTFENILNKRKSMPKNKCFNVINEFNKIGKYLEKIEDYRLNECYEKSILGRFKIKTKLGKKNGNELLTILDIYDKDVYNEEKSISEDCTLSRLVYMVIKNVSSGELEFLKKFAFINRFIEDFKYEEYVTLVFDEIETYLHPEWCRKFLSLVLEELKEKYKDKKFKLIFATHSPFLLSDVLSKDCILLDKEDDRTTVKKIEQTFGANIHDILKDSMFMDSTFGEFARNKIKYVIEILNKKTELSEKELSKIKFIIENIGEPLIKNRLNKMLKDYLKNSKKEEKEEKVKEILKNSGLNEEELIKLVKNLEKE